MNSLPLTRVSVGTRESLELQPHKWKDNSVSHYPISLPNSPRKCNPDLLVRGTFSMAIGDRWQWMILGSKAAVTVLQSEPAALQPCSATSECELQTLDVSQSALHWASRYSGLLNIFSCWGICTAQHKPTHTFPQLPQSKATLEWSFYPNYLTKCIQFILL